MPREKETYRKNLELILEAYPNKKLLSISDVVKFTGLNRRTVLKLFSFDGHYISIANLAREMS